MGLVLGKDVVLLVSEDEETYKPIACARSITFDTQTEFIETSGLGSSIYRTYIPTACTISGNMDGLVFLDTNNTDVINYGVLYEDLLYKKLFIKFEMIDETGLYYFNKNMQVYIESISETTSFDNITTFSVNFKGTGLMTIDYGEI